MTLARESREAGELRLIYDFDSCQRVQRSQCMAVHSRLPSISNVVGTTAEAR